MNYIINLPLVISSKNILEMYDSLIPSKLNFNLILEKLKNNKYNNILDWYNDMDKYIKDICYICGTNTVLGLVISTVKQIFTEHVSVFEISFKKRCVKYIRDEFILDRFNHTIEVSPNSFSDCEKQKQNRIDKMNISPSDSTNRIVYDDNTLSKLKSRLGSIKSRREMSDIRQILQAYESMDITCGSEFQFNLSKLSPYTVRIIESYLSR